MSLETLFPLILSNTDMELWSQCQLRWFRERCQWLRRAGKSIDLIAGASFASGIEKARKAYYVDKLPSEEAIDIGYYHILDSMHKEMEDTDVLKSPERMANALITYFQKFPFEQEDTIPMELEDGGASIEHTLTEELPIYHPELQVPLIFKGKLDMLATSLGRTYIVDEKTTKAISDNTADLLRCSGQFIGYCLTPEHEVLTEKGWVSFPELEKGVPIMCWDTDGTLTWQEPLEYIKQPYKGILHEIKGKISLIGTPEHRQPIFDKYSSTFITKTLGTLTNNGNYRFISGGNYTDANIKDVREHFPEDLVRLLVATQADGHITVNKDDTIRIVFSFKKDRKITRLRSLLERLNLKFEIKEQLQGVTKFTIYPCKETGLIYYLLGDTKSFGSYLLKLSASNILAFVNELQFWDGSIRKDRDSFIYVTTNIDNVEWVQTLSHLCNKYTSVHTQQKAGNKLVYRVIVSDTILHSVHLSDRNLINYEGYVYCVRVPTSFFMVRHKNKISITGNSWLLRQKGYPVVGAKIRKVAIQVREVKVKEFEIPITDYMIDLWYESLLNKINLMAVSYKNVTRQQADFKQEFFPDFANGCTAYFRPCPYMDGCSSKFGEKFIESNFEQICYDAIERKEVSLKDYKQMLGV